MQEIFHFAQTRKFWVAVAGALVTYLVTRFGESAELTLFTGLLTALGVYGVRND